MKSGKKRDSWEKRYEEQRQDDYHENEEVASDERELRRIEENRKKVGVFDRLND